MTTAEERLDALFAADEPPARDRVFEAAVMARLARRRFAQDMALLSIATLVGGAVLGGVWDRIEPALDLLSQGLAPAAAGVAVVVAAAMVLRLQVFPAWDAET